jgi:hypothetical protein
MVTVTHPDGRVLTRVVNVTQLAREMFEAITANPYAAAGGECTFTVTSDVPWKLARNSTSDPSGIITLGDESVDHPATPSFVYTFTLLANNTTFVERSASILVTSSDPDFPPGGLEILITQGGVTPYITITDPAAGVIDFGTAATAKSVTFKTNAGRQFTTTSTYADVVSTSSLAAGTAWGSATSPISELTGTVTFTPRHSAGTETEAAGTELETVVTFSTVTGATPEATDALTLKRTVLVRWGTPSFDPTTGNTLPRTGASVKATVATNAAWSLTENITPASTTATASAYATGKNLTRAIPNNNTWSSRAVAVTASCTGGGSTPANYTQKGYTLSVSNAPDEIAQEGGSYNVQFNGDCPNFSIRVWSVTDNSQLWVNTNAAGLTGSASNRAYTVPENTTTTSRTIRLEYRPYTTASWVTVQTYTQYGTMNPYTFIPNGMSGYIDNLTGEFTEIITQCPSGYTAYTKYSISTIALIRDKYILWYNAYPTGNDSDGEYYRGYVAATGMGGSGYSYNRFALGALDTVSRSGYNNRLLRAICYKNGLF